MTDEPETPPAAPEAAPASDPIAEAVNAWVCEHIHNSPVSRATEAMNHLVKVLPHLLTALKGV